MKCTCIRCSKLLIEYTENNIKSIKILKGKDRLTKIIELSSKTKKCNSCNAPKPKTTKQEGHSKIVLIWKKPDNIEISTDELKQELNQIKQIFRAVENKSNLYPKNLFTNDYNLINPTKWKIR